MVSIGFVGDVYPGRVAGLTIEPAVLSRLRQFDVLVANLEGPVTGLTEVAVEKGAHLRSAPGASTILDTKGVGVVSLANNHMFDFGTEGFRDTVSDLDRSGIAWVGAGEDLRSARRSLIKDTDAGMRVGFLAYSSPTIETVCATEQSAGCAPLDLGVMEQDVRLLAGNVDLAVVLLHWGLTGYELPTPEHYRLGPTLRAAGATLVVGSHSHVVQGIIMDGSGLVAFSLGDFAFYPETAEGRAVHQYRARQTGMILSVDVRRGGVVAHDVILTRQRATTLRSRLREGGTPP